MAEVRHVDNKVLARTSENENPRAMQVDGNIDSDSEKQSQHSLKSTCTCFITQQCLLGCISKQWLPRFVSEHILRMTGSRGGQEKTPSDPSLGERVFCFFSSSEKHQVCVLSSMDRSLKGHTEWQEVDLRFTSAQWHIGKLNTPTGEHHLFDKVACPAR